MKSRLLLGTLLLLGLGGGEAAAQCAAGTQVQNTTGTTETATFTFNGSTNPAGSITIAGMTGTYSGNRNGVDQALALDSTAAGAQPAPTGGWGFAGNYTGWSAGPAGGVGGNVVVFTSTTPNTDVANITFSVGGNAILPTVATVNGSATGTPNLTNLLSLSLVCGRPGASYPGNANDRWQEQHRASNELWDYKLGSSTIDPTKQVGTWSVAGTGAASQVTHSYFGPSYAWTVHNNGTFYSFCTGVGGAEHVRAFITTPGTLATANCGGSYPP